MLGFALLSPFIIASEQSHFYPFIDLLVSLLARHIFLTPEKMTGDVA